MTNYVLDNSIKNLGKSVLWQYDRAVRLLSLMKHMQVLYHCAVEQFWDFWREKVLSIETCGSFGCSVWGIFLGVQRPKVKGMDGTERWISPVVYRRILKGAFYLMKSGCSYSDILGYIEILFGIDGDNSLSRWTAEVSEYGWTTNIDEINGLYEVGRGYAKGDIVWYRENEGDTGANYEFLEDVLATDNTGWEAVRSKVEETEKWPNIYKEETLLFKLFDPNGICRSINGAPMDALNMSTSYHLGEVTITATAKRRKKCGVTITDNGDMSMSYGKSEFFDEMHTDQKLLFEQLLDEFCPYPLGIKTNEPTEKWVLGFCADTIPDNSEEYRAHSGYSAGVIVLVPATEYDRYVLQNPVYWCYKTTRRITASENADLAAFMLLLDSGAVVNWGTVTNGNEPLVYQPRKDIPQNLIFTYKDDAGTVFSYQSTEYIPAASNTSFDAVRDKLKKVWGNPAIGNFALDDPPYVDLRKLQYPYRKHNATILSFGGGIKGQIIYNVRQATQLLVTVKGIEYVCLMSALVIAVGNFEYDSMFIQGTTLWVKENDAMEDIMSFLGEWAVSTNKKLVPFATAMTFDAVNTNYLSGMALDREEKIVSLYKDKIGTKDESWWANSTYPIWNTVLSGDNL